MVWVVGIGLLSIAASIWLPLNAGFLPSGDNPTTITVFGLVGLIWLLAALVTLERQPTNTLWKLILAYLVWQHLVWALQFVPSPVVQGVTSTFAPMSIALYVHILVAYPSGHLRLRFDRRLVVFVYDFVLGAYLLPAAMRQPAGPTCPTTWCPANVLLVWPNKELADALGRIAQLVAPVLGALVLYAIWRHWRAAGPAGRRALLPLALARPPVFFFRAPALLTPARPLGGGPSFLVP